MNHLDWEFVIGRYLDGIATAEEIMALSAKLESDADTRLLYLRLAGIHAKLATDELAEPIGGETEGQLRDLVVQLESSVKRREDLVGVNGQRWPKSTVQRLLAVAAGIIAVLSVGLVYQLIFPGQVIREASNIVTHRSIADAPIARITGLSGSLIWTGDRGQIVRDVKVGRELTGGTIEGRAPDSWFELQFNDGSTLMISGTSMLTFSDLGQKKLRLREGVFSANVVPQPNGKPMVIHTPSALLEVMGTQFDVEVSLASTMLNVTEGMVRLKRLSDRREIDVPANHRVIAEGDGNLTTEQVPKSVHRWKTQLDVGLVKVWGNYGRWLPATGDSPAAMKAIPFVPCENESVTLHLLGLPVIQADNSPVVVKPGSRFIVRGRLDVDADVYFGIRVARPNGEFAGKFLAQQEGLRLNHEGDFELTYTLDDFDLDPCVRDREHELATRPDNLALTAVWAFTLTGTSTGLEVTEVELIPPEREEKR